MSAGRVIAIDGPAASGKSTTAQRVAERLGFWHLNSGLLYRAITWVALERGWDEGDERFADQVAGLEIRIGGTAARPRVAIAGTERGEELQTPEVTARVSAIAARRPVRELVLHLLREAASTRDVVCDGRDIGTVVFPEAVLKVFLIATAEERARRRLLDYGREPTPARVEKEARRLRARDRADSHRDLAPLRRADDAVEIDTTDLDPEAVVERILALATGRGIGTAGE
ncbi:MAG: (d)CMP kinase [Gemmatimonadota bacterium]